jgi:dCMP deaminase
MKRISKDDYYLDIALSVSKRSTCLKRHYGCVIVKNDEIIASGYNGSPRGLNNCCDIGFCPRINEEHNSGDYSNCHSVHAEQNAMLSASRKDMIGSTMYLACEELFYNDDGELFGQIEINKCEPCPICARMLSNAGIEKLITTNGEVNFRMLL